MFKLLWSVGLCLSLFVPQVLAQEAAAKLGPRLKMLVGTRTPAAGAGKISAAGSPVQLLIQGAPAAVRLAVEAGGGSIGAVVGDISTARVHPAAIGAIVLDPAVERLERALPLRPTNDRAASHVRGRLAQRGAAPLPRGYTGAGVLVGIIDTGIDFGHLDFRDPDQPGRSRILAIWDQIDEEGPHPAGYGYGTEWTRDQIEASLQGGGPVRHVDWDGHGSHVSGSAAGNGAAVGQYAGLAPEADIAVVADEPNVDASLVDAVHYIFELARERGQPAVANLSAGIHLGPHDDSSLEIQALNALLQEAPGRAFVVSAGNEGADFIHWGDFDLEPDSLWTYYFVPPDAVFEDEAGLIGSGEFFSTIATDDPASAYVAVGLDRMRVKNWELSPLGYEGRTQWYSLAELIELETGTLDTLRYADGRLAGEVSFSAQVLEGGQVGLCTYITDYVAFVDLEAGQAVGADLWRFMARGTGRIHTWNEYMASVESWEQVADQVVEIAADRYRPTDNRYSVALPAVGSGPIAVGASVNAPNPPNPYAPGSPPVGALAAWSSRGPTTDGRLKPELVAPGENVVSVLSEAFYEDVAAFGADSIDPQERHVTFSGTSMSAPLVAGAVALYLQQHPEVSNAEIREAFFQHAAIDAQTASSGSLPNSDWGYGKLDVFAVLAAGVPAPGSVRGDFNRDGLADLEDFFLFVEAFGGAEPRFDLDADGRVGLGDLFLFADEFSGPRPGR